MSFPRSGGLLPLLTALLLALGVIGCREVDAVGENPVGKEAEEYLVRYLRIDTSNPPGNETSAAKFLQDILRKEGIDAQLVGSNPARQSVYARLRSGSSAPALILLHHLDVVPAKPSQWSVPPFSGQISGGYIWGRGALDVKSLGIANLMAVLDLKRTGAKLSRDVIFLGVADEEGGGEEGIVDLLNHRAELFSNVGYVLNEGGGNETVVDRISFWGIEIDQKVPLWVRLVARGSAGHGAIPPDDGGSPLRLLQALDQIRTIQRPYRLTPSVAKYFEVVARQKPGIKQQILRNPNAYLDSPLLERELSPAYRALLRDTVAITRLDAGDVSNSIPAVAAADLDLRLLPGSDPGPVIEELRKVAGKHAELQVLLQTSAAPPSSTDTDLFRALEKVLRRAEPSAGFGPFVSPGTSDSRFFRARAIVAYGISPFKVNYYDANTVHGIDERIRSRFFSEGVDLMRRIVREFCVQGNA